MRLWLIPLDHALPALQEYLAARNDEPLDAVDSAAVAEMLEEFVKTGQVLIAFALYVAGRPSS